jgi:hypothetical protein
MLDDTHRLGEEPPAGAALSGGPTGGSGANDAARTNGAAGAENAIQEEGPSHEPA